MNAVFLKILNMSLTASLLILAVLPVRLLLKKAPKWTSCLLWGIVAVALVCPVRFESRASVLPAADPIVITSDTPQTNDTRPLYREEPILIQDIIENQNATGEAGTPLSLLEIGTAVWCLGMIALLGYAVFSTLRLKRQVAASLETEHRIFLCDDIDTPFILGILRPRVYLPSALEEATAAQVLLHERAHLARKDHWWKPLGYLLLTLHWFNPLVWVAYSLLCTDIELACDEKVIKDMDSGSKQSYSEALLTCSTPRHLIAACPLAFGEVGVKQRIGAVLHYKKPAFWVIVIAIAVCIALCFGFLTNPVTMTLDSIGDVFAEEIESVRIVSKGEIPNIDREPLFKILSIVEVQPEYLIKTPLDLDFHTIILKRTENAATYELCFSSDFTKLQLNRIVKGKDGNTLLYDKHYKVLNPEVLQDSAFLNSLLPDSKSTTLGDMSGLTAENVSNITVQKNLQTGRSVNNIAATCKLLQDVQLRQQTGSPTIDVDWAVISLVIKNSDVTYHLYFSPDHTRMWLLSQDTMTSNTNYEQGTYYEVLTPDIISQIIHSEFLYLYNKSEIGSSITLPFAVYPDMDSSFTGYEALYDAIKTYAPLELQHKNDFILIGTKTIDGRKYAIIQHSDDAVLLEYVFNSDSSVTIRDYAKGTAAESMGNYGYAMNFSQLDEKSIYWTTFRDKRWATTADGKETDTSKTVPTDYTGFRFIWADLQQEEYTADDGFFLAEVNSVIPPAIAIPMVGNKPLTALGWRLP